MRKADKKFNSSIHDTTHDYKTPLMKKIFFIALFIIACCLLSTANCFSQWTYKAFYGGGERMGAVGFSIGNKGYIGTGGGQIFWEYDLATNSWTQKANFGGVGRRFAIGFSIGNKGYIGTGESGSSVLKDFWEYDPATDTWTQKADLPGVARKNAVGFSIGNKGYISTGLDSNNNKLKDFWEYDPVADSWTQKADFGGTARTNAVGFSIGFKAYIGTGYNSSGYLKDFWEYDPSNDTWSQKNDLAGIKRMFAVGFSIDTLGYIGTGSTENPDLTYLRDFWEYDPATDTWTQKSDFGGYERSNAVGFSIVNKGYIGTGWNELTSPTPTVYKDFWEYDPDGDTYGFSEIQGQNQLIQIFQNLTSDNISISCQQKVTIEILNINGQIIEYIICDSGETSIDIGDFASGVYFVRALTDKEIITKKIIKE
jgi:N-acetylneuraminic acid mutarotase